MYSSASRPAVTLRQAPPQQRHVTAGDGPLTNQWESPLGAQANRGASVREEAGANLPGGKPEGGAGRSGSQKELDVAEYADWRQNQQQRRIGTAEKKSHRIGPLSDSSMPCLCLSCSLPHDRIMPYLDKVHLQRHTEIQPL
ncbi:spermatogenesis-associated protein 45 isoform X1 [Felis catus]|uniref:spermatogenesis-associated protein 45 isoform X1 n=1 Tax=Felis catus TaxID=9685 RepID=UPI001D1A258B|nr:spermatogenesis-associated protein 45 isoform X1 [Felis catus]